MTRRSIHACALPCALLTLIALLSCASAAFAQSSVPAPWSGQDIGNPSLAGSASYSSGVFTIKASGSDIWGTSDQFYFVYQQLTGDGELIARVDGVTATQAWSKAGVMMRETLTAGSKHAYALVSAAKGVAFQRRLSTGGSSSSTAGSLSAPPRWVRLVRKGSTFQALESSNGTSWQSIGSSTITMASTIYVGIAVTSHNTSSRTTATVSSVGLTAGTTNQPPTVSITSPVAGASFLEPASVALQASASDPDGTIARVDFYNGSTNIGSATAAPFAATWSGVTAGTYSLTAVATDNLGATTTSSPVSIAVTQAASGLPAPWSSQDIGAPAMAGSATFDGTKFTVIAGGADIWGTADQFHYVYQLLTGDGQIIARVDSVTAATGWSKAGVMMRETLAPGSKHAYALLSAYNGVAFQRRPTTDGSTLHTAGAAVSAPYWVKLVRHGDIFDAYQSATSTGTWQLVGSETIPMAQTIYFGLAVTAHSTTATTTAMLSSVSASATATTTTTNQPPTVAITSPAAGATFTAPATISISASASDSDGTVSKVAFYQGATLIGSSTTAPYGVSWSSVAAGTYSLTAVATDNSGATTTSAAVSVTVGTGTNKPPTVAITSPAAGATFTAPATVSISASASDSDGTVSKVAFYQGATLIGSSTTPPYAVTWSSVAAGIYSLTAVATDNSGASTTSAAVGITVKAATNQPPTVTVTTPVSGSIFYSPTTVAVSASASDTDGTIARVDFYQGSTLIASDTTSPYTVNWVNAVPGTYTITAVATDNGGASTTSAAITATVKPSQAVFTASTDTTVTSYTLDIFVAGANVSTTTPAATQNLGKPTASSTGDITADITTLLRGLAPGTYFATVTAVSPSGSARSAASANFTR